MPPPDRPSPVVYVVYDGTKKVKGLLKRVRKRFPAGWGRSGLKREVKEFFLEKRRAGKNPAILGADLTPLFGPRSKEGRAAREEFMARELAHELSEKRRLAAGALFDNTPDQLPD